MGLYRLPAVVLRTYPFSDTHLIAALFSPSRGKVRAIAKGTRRIQSALGPAVQPMVFASFQLAEGRNLDCITQGVVKSAFPKIRGSLERLLHGLYALELIDRLIEEPEPQIPVFFLLLKTLEGLEAGLAPPLLLRVFEAHLFRHLGYAPELENCVACGEGGSGGVVRFSPRLGGVLCAACREKDKLSLPLAPEALRALRICANCAPGEVPELSASAAAWAGEIFQRFLEDKCGKVLHGFELFKQVGLTEKTG